MRRKTSSARTAVARMSSRAGPPSAPSRRRKAPDNGICGHCTNPGHTNPGQLTRSASRRRLVASKKASGRRAICAAFLSPYDCEKCEDAPCGIRKPEQARLCATATISVLGDRDEDHEEEDIRVRDERIIACSHQLGRRQRKRRGSSEECRHGADRNSKYSERPTSRSPR